MQTAPAKPSLNITEAMKQQYRDEGYMIIENAIPDHLLQLLRDQCQYFIDEADRKMDEQGVDSLGLTHRGRRYFVPNCRKQRPIIREFLFSDVMAEVCRATLGDNAQLFNEQYVVKGIEGMKFSWHQDSGYVGHDKHEPYLSCWCPLDDITEENGPVHLLPFSTLGIKTYVKHIREPGTNDMVGYFGKDKGITPLVKAGDIVAFSSVTFHSSGANRTSALRRVYLAQYSSSPIMNYERTRLWNSAEPILKNGIRQDGTGEP